MSFEADHPRNVRGLIDTDRDRLVILVAYRRNHCG